MAVIKNLMVRAGGDFSALKKSMEKSKKDIENFKKSVSGSMKALKAALATLAIGKLIKDSIGSAMEVESAINQIKRIMGESSNAFLKWAKDSALAFNMSRSEAIKYGSVFGNLINGFSSGTGETLKYTEELLKSAAIVAAGTGRTMEDTLDRIRSGLLGNTESIEDLGINVNVAMIQSTDAFKKFANGKTWQQLDYKVQQQIRLMAILEQASKKYGDTVTNTTAAQQQRFIAQLKNIQLNIGNAFLPIYQVILPALNGLANKLEYVTNVASQFMQALFGKAQTTSAKATEKQADAIGGLSDAYTQAGKSAKGALAGFDEVNSLSDTSSSGAGNPDSSSSSSASNISSDAGSDIPDISAKVQAMADKVKMSFSEMGRIVSENKSLIVSAVAGIGTAFGSFALISNAPVIISTLKTALTGLAGLIGGISLPALAVAVIIGALVAAFTYFYQTNEKFRGIVDGILNSIKEAALNLWNNALVPLGQFLGTVFVNAWNGVTTAASWLWKNVLVPFGNFMIWLWQNVFSPVTSIIKDGLGIAFSTVATIAKSLWQNALVPMGNFLKDVFKPTIDAVAAVFGFLWNTVLAPFSNFLITKLKSDLLAVVTVLQFLWINVLKPLGLYVSEGLKTAFDGTFKMMGTLIADLKVAFIGLMDFITGVFTGDWDKAWNGIRDVFAGVFSGLYDIVKVPLNLIISAINTVIGGINKLSIKVPDWVPNVGGKSWGISIPTIPALKSGGITNGPMTALIGDNVGGREVVSPLGDLMDMIASAVGTAVMQASQFSQQNNSTSGDVVIKINDKELARAIIPALDKERNRIGYAALQGGL